MHLRQAEIVRLEVQIAQVVMRGGTEEERRKLKAWIEQFMPEVARRLK